MAADDMASNRATTTTTTARSHNGPRRTRASSRSTTATRAREREAELSTQIHQLQDDIKSISGTLTRYAENRVNLAQSAASRSARNLARSGQSAVEDMQDEFGQIERQIKDTIREKPFTAVAGALALGFILAVVTR